MHNQQTTGASEVKLSLGLAPSLNRVLTSDQLQEAVRRKVASELVLLLGVLGIPGKAEVKINLLEGVISPEDPSLRVSVNGRICNQSQTLLERAISYMSDDAVKTLNGWLDLELEVERTADLFALLCIEIIKAQPAILLGTGQTVDYASRLNVSTEAERKAEAWLQDPVWLGVVLSKVLNLGISIADHQKVEQVLTKGLVERRSTEDVAEDLIGALRPDALEVHLPLSYLKEITSDGHKAGRGKFSLMRDGLFYELGIRLPQIRFVIVEDLRPQSFRFKINHLTTLPQTGLSPTQYLANDTADRLKLLNIEGKAVLNPANGNENSLIDSTSVAAAEAADVYCWSPIGYVVLGFSAELRNKGASLVYRDAVEAELEQLELAFPALVKAARSSISIEQMTRVLRFLIAEKISIRNLKLILEKILEYDYIVTDTSQFIVFDERVPVYREPPKAWIKDPANIASFIRIGMKRYLKHQYAPNGFLEAYLLSPEIERIMSQYGIDKNEGASLDEGQREKILNAVRAGVVDHSGYNRSAVILTNTHVRPFLREVLYTEFPGHVILAYEELGLDLSIQEIDRISLKPDI